jgi:formiminoglutamase
MNLSIFFDALSESLLDGNARSKDFYSKVDLHKERFPDWKSSEIAIIGITEDRGTENKNIDSAPDEVRKKLFKLNKGTGHNKICDLGNLRRGVSLNETYLRLKEVCDILIQHQIFPLIIGGGHDMDLGQYYGYETSGKLINLLNVDAWIDINNEEQLYSNGDHIHKIIVREPNFLFHYAHLAYQSFLNDSESINILEKLHFETYRIGVLRENIEDMEPVVRNADMLSFDISSIKSSDAPGNIYAQPFGLTGEEACQLCWYAGLSTRLSSAGFYEYNPHLDHNGHTASIMATMVWYLIEGFANRNNEHDFNSSHFVKYIVSLPQEPHKIVFYKNIKSEKWWMEVLSLARPQLPPINTMIPCSYKDYTAAIKGEIPNRWMLAQTKQ